MKNFRTHRAASLRASLLTAFALCLLTLNYGCPAPRPSPGTGSTAGVTASNLSGEIKVDGSSTVAPISEAMAEEFQAANSGVRITVGTSGTGGGFKKFAGKEIDVSDASRPIKTAEAEALTKAGIEFIEIPVAYDGLAVVVNSKNTWANCLTVAELKKVWDTGSTVSDWSQVRAGFPRQPIKLYGAGTDSGTFDYFTDAVNGKEGASRSDYTASEDDNTLVTGVAGDGNALGYFGFAYYEENKERLKLVQIDGGDGCVAPSVETVMDGSYQPLSRPLLIYVRKDAASRPEVQAFIRYFLGPEGRKLVSDVGYIPLPDRAYELALERFEKGVTGSMFTGGSQVGVKIEDLLAKEAAGDKSGN